MASLKEKIGYALGDAAGLDLASLDHGRRRVHDGICVFKASDLADQVETVGMECLDLHEVGRIADQSDQPFLEHGGRGP